MGTIMRDVWEYMMACAARALALRQQTRAIFSYVAALLALPVLWALKGYALEWTDLVPWLVAWWLTVTALLLFLVAPFLLWREQRQANAAVGQARNLRTLITAELANVAFGLIGAERTLSGYVRSFQGDALVGDGVDIAYLSPRLMPHTTNLSSELLTLEAPQIDVLATLQNGLDVTRRNFDEVDQGQQRFSLLSAQRLLGFVRGDLAVMAQAFERFAADRKFQLEDGQPQLASELLRKLSRGRE
jgi:hypothetical protein